LVSDIKGGTQTEGVSQQGIGESWAEERDEGSGGWRKLYEEELLNLYSSPSIIRMINSRRVRWAGHVARMWPNRQESQKERDH
jgi:hypothetical protein